MKNWVFLFAILATTAQARFSAILEKPSGEPPTGVPVPDTTTEGGRPLPIPSSPPPSPDTHKTNPGFQILHICYPSDSDIEKSCEAVRKQLRDCGVPLAILDDPTIDQIVEKKKEIRLDASSVVMVSAHGGIVKDLVSDRDEFHVLGRTLPRYGDLEKLQIKITSESPFRSSNEIAIGSPVKSSLFERLARLQKPVHTRDDLYVETGALRKALGPEIPLMISACHSGQACGAGAGNMATSCRASEYSRMAVERNGQTMEYTEAAALDLYCDADTFRTVDRSRDGNIDKIEWEIHLSQYRQKSGGGLRSMGSGVRTPVCLSKEEPQHPQVSVGLKLPSRFARSNPLSNRHRELSSSPSNIEHSEN